MLIKNINYLYNYTTMGKRKRSRSTKKGGARRRRGGARGPWGKKVFKAKNGSTYVKNKRG